MYIVLVAIISYTIYAIVEEICDYLKEKNKKEAE